MAVTKPTITTVAVGQKITASLWNGAVYTDANFWAVKKPFCMAYDNSGTISIPSSGLNTVNLNSEFWDTDGMHSTTTNTSRITINTAGVYKVWGSVSFASNATGTRGGIIKMNSTTTVEPTYTQGAADNFNTVVRLNEAFVLCAVGDYFEVQAYQNTGAALTLTVTAGMKTYLAVEYFGDTTFGT